MSRQSHILSTLQLFDTGPPVWTVEQIASALAVSVSTAYRTVRELTQAGFLDPVSGAGYVLGPAFIRFDRVIRQSDPLVHVATPVMDRLLEETSQEATVLLCRRFKDCIMSVHIVEGREPHLPASYERGAAMPLFIGAPAKVILSFLPDRVLRGLYLRNEATLHASGIDSWQRFKAQLKPVRKAGFAMTVAEISEGRIGIAAPILREGLATASLSLVVSADWLQRDEPRLTAFAAVVRRAAHDISQMLERQDSLLTPR